MLFARFLDGPRGRLFTVGFRPPGPSHPTHWVLMVPPFFEELNKSRRTLSLLGRALAAQGVGCLLPDLYGTGDSEGEVCDADWAGWIEDITRAHGWLLEQGAERVDLLALRGGALLGWHWLAAAATPVPQLILWHPIPNGRQLVQQLLRLRLAGGLMGRESAETAALLRARLAQEGSLEIAGYRLSAGLIASLEGSALGPPGPRRVTALDWYQIIATAEQPIPPTVAPLVETWRDAGITSRVHAVTGDSFWATQEITEGTGLITTTIKHLMAARTGNGNA